MDHMRLRQWLTTYKNPEAVYRDVTSVFNYYKNLTIQKEPYTESNGMTTELVNLTGTIPVDFRGVTYNIPICIWLCDTHPTNPPICYVKPTSDMSITVSQYVNPNGKIYLPYLTDWNASSSDLLGLIQVMVVTFGDEPPVYTKSKSAASANNMCMISSPYNPQGYNGPVYPTPTPYPSTSGYPGAFPTPYPTNNFLGFNPYSKNTYPAPYPPAGPFPMPTPPTGTNTTKDGTIRDSLLTAIEEKLIRKMKEQFMQTQAELQTLRKIQEELSQGKTKLDTMLSKLEKEQKDLDKNITVLKDKEQELNTAIERIGNQESIDVDNAVTTTAPLYKQLLNAYAEEAALEDAIYYMGEALRAEVIDLDIFLRQVRTLSRKQFMLRALMQKCRQKAGLAM